jgi:hypothetical protein
MLGIDRSGFYEIAETIADRDGHSVYAVREITLEAPGQLYRIPLTTTGSHEALLARFENIVLPFAHLRHSQVPLLCDAWVSDDFFDMVLLIPVCKPLNIAGPNPFREADEATRMFFLRESLDFLAAMHDQEITHCHFREDCLGIDKRGILYLHNPGIAERLIAVQREEDDDLGSGARLKLSANMKSIDVACWANSVAGLMIGRPVLTYEFDEWDETELRKAEAAIFGDLGKTSALGKFLMQCLRGRMFDSVGYNSGREALKELDRIPPAPTFK